VAILEGLGVWPALATEAEPFTAIEISDSAVGDAMRPTRLTYDAVTPAGRTAAYMVPASALQRELRRALSNQTGITWLSGAATENVSLGEHRADVTLSDGRVVSAALCVAADGRNSTLREAAGIKTVGWDYPQTGIVTTVKFSEPHHGVAIQHFLPGGPFAILPLKNDRACITWSAAKDEADRVMQLSDAEFLAELDSRITGRFGTITLDGPRQSWPLDVRLPRDLIARRFALIGDAAHGVHPIAGQGVNLALRDAAALTDVLVDCARAGLDFGSGVHLDRYQHWRRFDATMSASLYDTLNRLFSADNVILRAGRGAALGVLDRLPAIKQMIIAEASGVTGELPTLARKARA
jgi:2-octaprenyl-6-methoxyphenol hydroxylase